MPERLVHWSREPLGRIRSETQGGDKSRFDKPNGLWVSVEGNDDGWRWWCQAEEFALDSFAVEHEITLDPNARILRIAGALELRVFTERYACGPWNRRSYAINWPDVAASYQGIIIAPYVWECRLCDETTWYYSWDCASGCIWDASAIADVRIVEALAA